jgi:hypothetical protein
MQLMYLFILGLFNDSFNNYNYCIVLNYDTINE